MNTLELYDIYDMIHIPWWQTGYFYGCLCLVGVLIVGGMFFWWRWQIMRYQKKAYWLQALRSLDTLALLCDDSANAQKVYEGISSTLKRYLERRFGALMCAKTDQELTAWAQESLQDKNVCMSFVRLSLVAQYQKFAGDTQICTTMKEDVVRAREIIEKTLPREKATYV